MIYTNKNAVKNKLNKFHKNVSDIESELIFCFIKDKEYSDDKLIKLYGTIKYLIVNYGFKSYYNMSNTILSLLEKVQFNFSSTKRMAHLLSALTACNFEMLNEEQLEFFFNEIDSRQFSKENTSKLIYGAYNKYFLSSSFEEGKRPNLISILGNETMTKNTNTFLCLHSAFAKFKSSLKAKSLTYSHEDVDNIIKKCWEAIKIHTHGTNANFRKFTEEEMSKLYTFGIIYNTLTSIEDNDTSFSDEIITRLADRYSEKPNLHMKKSIGESFSALVENLTSPDQQPDEIFSSEEMRELISNNFKLVYKDSEKEHIVRNILKNYINTLANTSDNKTFKEFSTKDIIKADSSLLLMKPYNVYESSQLLLGNTATTTFNNAQNKNDLEFNYTLEEGIRLNIRKKLVELFPNLKISNITEEKHLEIIQQFPHLLTNITLFRLHEAMTALIDTIYTAYGLEGKETTTLEEKRNRLTALGFDCNSFFDGDNILDIFSNYPFTQLTGTMSSHKEYLSENITLLSQFLSPQEIQEVIRHNYSILTQTPQTLFEKISLLQKKFDNEKILKAELFNLLGIENYVCKDYDDLLLQIKNQAYAKQLEELIFSTRKSLEEIISQPLTQTINDENTYNKTYNYLMHKLNRVNNQYKALTSETYSEQLNLYENAK